MELCLGTVQFGMDYGIRGQRQPALKDAVEMLQYATQNGICAIDTANAYGTAEDVVGTFLQRKTIDRHKLFLVSKSRPNLLDECTEDKYYDVMKDNLTNTLKRLHTDYLDSYLLHSARYIYNDVIIDTLNRLKQEGYAKKVGVSVYEKEEAQKCIERPNVDFMQIPYSIFDQRMLTEGILEEAKKNPIQIHARSAFIQGLITMEESDIPPFLEKAKPIVKKIDKMCKEYGISRVSLALNFVKYQSGISHLVFGVDNMAQLKEDIKLFEESIPKDIILEISKEFQNIETDIVMPSLWKKEA